MSKMKLHLEEVRGDLLALLSARASHVCEGSASAIISNIKEMEDAPDQQKRHLSRDDVARMLAQFEQGQDPAWPGERCPSGVWRANRFQPDLTTDFEVEDSDESDDSDWEYDLSESDIAESDINFDDGESSALERMVDKAIHSGGDISVTLGDGSEVVLDPHTLQGIKNAGLLSDFHTYISDLETFSAAISHPIAGGSDMENDDE